MGANSGQGFQVALIQDGTTPYLTGYAIVSDKIPRRALINPYLIWDFGCSKVLDLFFRIYDTGRVEI